MKKRLMAVVTVALAAVFALALVGCGGGDSDKSESSSSTSAPSKSDDKPSAATDKYLTPTGEPNFLAMTELSGADMVKLLEGNGYKWDSDMRAFANSDYDNFSYMSAQGDVYAEDSKKVPAGGGADYYMIYVTDGFKTADKAAEGLAGTALSDEDYDAEDNMCFFAIVSSDKTQYFGVTAVDENEVTRVFIFSEAAYDAGLVDIAFS